MFALRNAPKLPLARKQCFPLVNISKKRLPAVAHLLLGRITSADPRKDVSCRSLPKMCIMLENSIFSVVSDMRHPSSGRRLLCGQEVGTQPPETVSLKCLRVGNTVSLPEEALERCAEQMRVVVFEV